MKRLNTQQVCEFVREGFIELVLNLPDPCLSEISDVLRKMNPRRNPGNNLLPDCPSLAAVVEHPVLRGAVESLLGPTAVLQPHRYAHVNHPGYPGQDFHRDSYFGTQRLRPLFPWELIVFFYPHDTPVEMGTTGVVPGSQYSPDEGEHFSSAEVIKRRPSGTVVICNYALWHRGLPNTSNERRVMVKFQFMRVDPPWRFPAPCFEYAPEDVGTVVVDALPNAHQRLIMHWLLTSARTQHSLSSLLFPDDARTEKTSVEDKKAFDHFMSVLEERCVEMINACHSTSSSDKLAVVRKLCHETLEEDSYDPALCYGCWTEWSMPRGTKGQAAAYALSLWPPGYADQLLSDEILKALSAARSEGKLAAATFLTFACGPHLRSCPQLCSLLMDSLLRPPMPSLSISGSRSFEKQTALEALRECPHEAIPNIIETAVQFLHCEEATVNKQMHFTAALLICSLVSGCSNVEGTISALAEAESKAENRYSRAFLRIALERLKDGSSQSANLIMRTVRCPFTNFVFPY